MSLTTPDRIRALQRKLYGKAKAEPAFRFYILYDKICREDILIHAYRLARENAGAPGVDGETFVRIETSGLQTWLAALREDLVSKRYRPLPVRRVMIPKPGGGQRPLGISRRMRSIRPADDPGSGGANRRQAGAGTDLRGGFRGQCLGLSTQAKRG
jgi:hypothetical protein